MPSSTVSEPPIGSPTIGLSADTRDIFKTELSVDEATWARGRGWALSQALIALSYYTLETNPVLVREAQRWMGEVLADLRPR